MKSARILSLLVLFSTTLRAEEIVLPSHKATPAPAASATTAAAPSAQSLLALCPPDMPPACACVADGKGVRVMPANEAYKNRKKVLRVGPKD